MLADAEARAARLWGADVCRFSTGGATHANQSVALAIGGEGDRVVVSRTLHRSMLLGLVLAGLVPVWVRPEVDPGTGLPLGVVPSTVADALTRYPDARAVLVGDPSYLGTVGDVAGLAEAAHAHGVPLVVDAAWAAHFGFHPDLPRHALQLGRGRAGRQRAQDAAGVEPGRPGAGPHRAARPVRLDAGWRRPPPRARRARSSPAPTRREPCWSATARPCSATPSSRCAPRATGSSAVEGLVVVDGPGIDPLKLTLLLAGTGADGHAVESDLLAAGCRSRPAERDLLVAVASLADTADTVGALVEAVVASIARRRGPPRSTSASPVYAVEPVPAPVATRRRTSRPGRLLAPMLAVGRLSVDLVAPYPPGSRCLPRARRSPRPPSMLSQQARTPASASRTPLTRRSRPCASPLLAAATR